MFDLDKVKKAAERLGMDFEVGSESPGVHFVQPSGEEQKYSFSELEASLKKEFKANQIISTQDYQIEYIENLDMNEAYEKKDELKKVLVDKHPRSSKDIEYFVEIDDSQYKHYTKKIINGVA